MKDEKPLHQHVAEALGWEWATFAGKSFLLRPGVYESVGWPGSSWSRGRTGEVTDPELVFFDSAARYPRYPNPPRYDEDWSATGPLIERLGIHLWVGSYYQGFGYPNKPGHWLAADGLFPDDKYREEGETPLIAVCNLILALKAAGKLEGDRGKEQG